MKKSISDSVERECLPFNVNKRCIDWLWKARHAWDNLDKFRKSRKRCKSYLYDDQWCETVEWNGRSISERKYIEMQGIPALQNNLIGKSVRTVMGVRRQQNNIPVCVAVDSEEAKLGDVMSSLLNQNMKMNKRAETDARTFEEFCMSGLSCYKVQWQYRDGKENVFTDYVNPNFIFFPQGIDLNFRDIRFIGQIHDLDFSEVLMQFSHSDSDDEKLKEIYEWCSNSDTIRGAFSNTFKGGVVDNVDFFMPKEYGKCRVIEIWSKERRKAWFCHDRMTADPYMIPYDEIDSIKKENERRIEDNRMKDESGYVLDEYGEIRTYVPESELELIEYERRIEEFWYYRYLSPLGHVLSEGVSPYKSTGEYFHPYVIKPYPYIDGEIHSFVENIIDQQRFVNHYVIMLDFCIKNAAKGVLAIDQESLTNDQSIEDIAEQYVKTNGYILYTSKKNGQIPKAIQNSSVPAGMEFMINLQRSFVEEVSGVQPALQGKVPNASTSGVLYNQQVTQSTATVFDLIETFNSFLRDVAYKVVKIIQAFYSDRKSIVISGEKMFYDPNTMGAVDYDISISENMDSPVYREANNNLLIELLRNKMIGLKTMLKAGNFPNSTKLLSLIEVEEQQLGELQSQIPDESMTQEALP